MIGRLLILLSFSCLAAVAALPPAAQKLLNTLPGKKISLKLVIQKGMGVSDSYRLLSADLKTLNVPILQAYATYGLDPTAYIEFGWIDDKTEASNAFAPSQKKGSEYKLGISKTFSTGTTVKAELNHTSQTISFAAVPGTPFFETGGTLSLSQKLWKDSFGYATRLGQQTGELQSKANLAKFEGSFENWILQIVEIYYGAWLAQTQSKIAKDNVARQRRLLKITRIKTRRGTAEEPDLLQVQSSHLAAHRRPH